MPIRNLIVTEAHGAGAVARLASHFGSIGHKVVSHAHCPVLRSADLGLSRLATERATRLLPPTKICWKGLILLGWGAAVGGQVDSLVRLGGVKAFGVMGFFIGPVVLSVTLVVLEMLQEQNLDYPAA